MKKSALAGSLVAACAAVFMGFSKSELAALAPATSAVGEGTMSFGHDGDGRGYLRFRVEDGEDLTGTLLFAAEEHHAFPDVVVQLGNVEKAEFKARSVEFSGPGRLHDDPVTVTVVAHDRAASKKADRFVIKCTDPSGTVVFDADGELVRGDIRVGSD